MTATSGGNGWRRGAHGDDHRSSQTYLELVMGATTDVVLHLDDAEVCRWASPSVERVLGWRPEQLVGHLRQEFVHPDDHGALVVETEPPGRERERTYRFRTADGPYRWVSGRGRRLDPVSDRLEGSVIAIRDVDEAMQSRQEVASLSQRYRLVTEASSDAVTVTRNGIVEFASPAIESIVGEPAPALSGRSLFELVHEDDRRGLLEARGRSRRGTPESLRLRVQHTDGSFHWVDLQFALLGSEAGAFAGAAVGNWRIVDEEVAAIETLREVTGGLERFIAAMSHELRNPVAAIRSAIDLLALTAVDSSRVAQVHDIVDRQLGHLTRLLDDPLDISRASLGLIDVRIKLVDMADVVADAVSMVRRLVDERGHRLLVNVVPEMLVDGDEVRLVQAIANLLRNAASYTPEGGDIAVRSERRPPWVVVSVRDNGVGIEPDTGAQLVELFRRAPIGGVMAPDGLGIGLTLVQRIAELHGGRLVIESEGRGKGSTFRLVLPEADLGHGVPAGERASGVETSRRVLIVDDNADLGSVLQELLGAMGHTVRYTALGRTAIAIAAEEMPDVTFVDLGLGDMSGIEVAAAIRHLPGGDAAVIVAMTGRGGEPDRHATERAGLDAHLVKPLTTDVLRGALRIERAR
jgi:PAS domain S-box-containing protein